MANELTLPDIRPLIHEIRGQQVMLDRDLAFLYHVSTKALNQAVKRNITRFPERFMFQLSKDEFENWKSQIVTSNLSERLREIDSMYAERSSKEAAGFLPQRTQSYTKA